MKHPPKIKRVGSLRVVDCFEKETYAERYNECTDCYDDDIPQLWRRYVIEQPPRDVSIIYGGSHYRLWVPWLYYSFVIIWDKPRARNGLELRNSGIDMIFASPYQAKGPRGKRRLSLLPLPNMYDVRPCYYFERRCRVPDVVAEAEGYSEEEQLAIGHLNSFWMGGSNSDGDFIYTKVWRQLSEEANHNSTRLETSAVLKYWESLSPHKVRGLPWDKSYWWKKTFTNWNSVYDSEIAYD